MDLPHLPTAVVLNLSVHQLPEGLWKDGGAPRVSDSLGLGGREPRILARSQGMLELPLQAQGPHFENHCSIAKLLYGGPKVDLGKRTIKKVIRRALVGKASWRITLRWGAAPLRRFEVEGGIGEVILELSLEGPGEICQAG